MILSYVTYLLLPKSWSCRLKIWGQSRFVSATSLPETRFVSQTITGDGHLLVITRLVGTSKVRLRRRELRCVVCSVKVMYIYAIAYHSNTNWVSTQPGYGNIGTKAKYNLSLSLFILCWTCTVSDWSNIWCQCWSSCATQNHRRVDMFSVDSNNAWRCLSRTCFEREHDAHDAAHVWVYERTIPTAVVQRSYFMFEALPIFINPSWTQWDIL